jgi:hypothetical protein
MIWAASLLTVATPSIDAAKKAVKSAQDSVC